MLLSINRRRYSYERKKIKNDDDDDDAKLPLLLVACGPSTAGFPCTSFERRRRGRRGGETQELYMSTRTHVGRRTMCVGRRKSGLPHDDGGHVGVVLPVEYA